MLTQRRIDRQTDTQTDRHTERQTEGQSDSANRNTENTNNVEIGNNKNGGEQHANMARDDGGNFYTLHIFTYENIFCKFLSLLQRAPGTPVPSTPYTLSPLTRSGPPQASPHSKHLWDLCLPDMFAFCICDMFENPHFCRSFDVRGLGSIPPGFAPSSGGLTANGFPGRGRQS